MLETLVRIDSQYYENYGSAEAPYWKPKGGQEFTIRIDSDILFYNKEGVESVLAHMLDRLSGDYIRYELLSFEPVFSEPKELDPALFNALYDAHCESLKDEAYVEGVHYNRPE
jgi:hypothetical protein